MRPTVSECFENVQQCQLTQASFPFSRLPPELQLMIWEAAVIEPRTLRLIPSSTWCPNDGYIRLVPPGANKVPALLHTTYTSRNFAKKHYKLWDWCPAPTGTGNPLGCWDEATDAHIDYIPGRSNPNRLYVQPSVDTFYSATLDYFAQLREDYQKEIIHIAAAFYAQWIPTYSYWTLLRMLINVETISFGKLEEVESDILKEGRSLIEWGTSDGECGVPELASLLLLDFWNSGLEYSESIEDYTECIVRDKEKWNLEPEITGYLPMETAQELLNYYGDFISCLSCDNEFHEDETQTTYNHLPLCWECDQGWRHDVRLATPHKFQNLVLR